MGFFSNFALEDMEYDFDRSYPSPEEQLLWRLDDLNAKLDELKASDSHFRDCTRLTDNDIRYAIPEYFDSIADVERAIELAVYDLRNQYGIDILEEVDSITTELNNEMEQISLFDMIVSMPSPEPRRAA